MRVPNLPGLMNALSISHGLFVAAIRKSMLPLDLPYSSMP